MEIELKNKKGVVAKTLLSVDDYEKVKDYKWYLSGGYVKASNKTTIFMHRIIMNLNDPLLVVDHINHDKLDNRRENLRVVTRAANNQNRPKATNEDRTSKYKGVFLREFSHTSLWVARCGQLYNQSFKTEEEAARAYDKAALHSFGIGAEINFKYTDDELNQILAEPAPVTPTFVKKRSELPKGVWFDFRGLTRNPYGAKFSRKSLGMYATPEEASAVYEAYIKVHNKECEENHMNLKILRNEDGHAIIPIRNKLKEHVKSVIVDDDEWHRIMRHSCCVNKCDYVSIRQSKSITMLHRFLMNPPADMIVDHINGNKLDNRKENLRIVTAKQSSYNKGKHNRADATSTYKGVSKVTRKLKKGDKVFYMCFVSKDGVRYNLGSFLNELDAARAYNAKAQELFGEFANLNEFI
jgi:hypothetical protein